MKRQLSSRHGRPAALAGAALALALAAPALAQQETQGDKPAPAEPATAPDAASDGAPGTAVSSEAAPSAETEKAAEDPTKIATKLGIAYADELSASGSMAIGPKLKFNARIARSGQWSLGASYLLPVAIVTFMAGRSELDTGVKQTRYSLGGFVPLSQLGLKTGKWLIFVPFGYTYSNSRQGAVTDLDQQDGIPITVSSSSGYLGLFTIRPLTTRLTLMAGANYTRGTHDYSGVAAGGGLSYHLTKQDTAALRGSYVNNSFGTRKRIGISYQHEF
ncbi:hypothetical protein [Novosphingobium clariflavum]|uniref:Outer membrane protein beta-barrel domain-containing protein n=1 Tax=Novosphingobium clariflavum TaxID=2029884 RepID=A0ABV6S6F0_9SPHN|nr:hypothetical protein [Novosphingobium clariflavum]